MPDSTIEILMCSPRPGVSKAQVLEATRMTNAVLRRLPGYVEHEIAHAVENGRWIDIVHWSDPDAAFAAEAAFKLHPEAEAVSAVIEQNWVVPLCVELPLTDLSALFVE
jgi:hypothetical protein